MRKRLLTLRSVIVGCALSIILTSSAYASVPSPLPGGDLPTGTSSLVVKPEYVVILVMDGGLPSYLRLADFPHINALIRNGVRYTRAWDGMLESETPTGHASLGTGSLPRRHGIISFGWVTGSGQALEPTNPVPIQQGQLEQILYQSGVPSIASSLKQVDANARVVVTSGHKDYAVDSAGGWDADYLMYYEPQGQNWVPVAIPRHVPPQSVLTAPGLTVNGPHMALGDQDSLAVQLAMSAFRRIHQRATIINLPEFDWPLGHLQGGAANSWMAWQLTSRLDNDLANIEWEYWRAGVLGKTLFVLTADHGMETLNHTVSYSAIERAVSAAGTSIARYEFHTAGYLWLRDQSKVGAAVNKLQRLHDPHIRAIYFRKPGSTTYTAAPGTGSLVPGAQQAYQYLLSTFAGATAPQVAIVLTENTSILGREQVGWRGDHGGPSWNAEHIPLVMSGPGIRRGKTSSYPATIYDIAPTVLSLMGASPSGMDGVALADGMLQPTEGEQGAELNQGSQLAPLVKALMQQSQTDGP